MHKGITAVYLLFFIGFFWLPGLLCATLFPATVAPFAQWTCPKGTTPTVDRISESTAEGTSTAVVLQCVGEGGTEASRRWGVTGGWVLYLAMIALPLGGVGWLLLNRGLRPQPATQPLITLPPDLHTAAANDYEVLDSLTRGNKINAIKRVRTLTGLGLKEAKEFVEALARGDVVVPDGTPLNMNPVPQDRIEPFYDPEVQAHLAKGMKINAIKRVREITGLGLKEAKDLVDSWETR